MGRPAKNSFRLTDDRIRKMEPEQKEYVVWDTEVKGFGVRVRSNGGRFFTIKYSVGKGREAPSRKASLGEHSKSNTAAKARKIAEEWKAEARFGKDPYQQMVTAAKEEKKEREAPTMGKLAIDYFERHALKNKSEKSCDEDIKNLYRIGLVDLDYVRQYYGNYKPQPGASKKRFMKHLNNTKVVDITVRDIEDLHHKMKESPYLANRLVALLRKMFNLSIRWEWQESNPASSINRYHEAARERYLSEEEMARLFDALNNQNETVTVNAVKMMFLTGARKTETLRMAWDELDLNEGAWTKLSAHTKQKKTQRVPLSPPALQMLNDIKAENLDDRWVFPGRVKGLPLKEIKKTFAAAVKEAGITHPHGTRPYDSRHSYASILAGSGLSLHMIGRLMGHTQASTTQRYAHLADDPLRAATAKMGEVFDRVTDKSDQENQEADIIDFPKERTND